MFISASGLTLSFMCPFQGTRWISLYFFMPLWDMMTYYALETLETGRSNGSSKLTLWFIQNQDNMAVGQLVE